MSKLALLGWCTLGAIAVSHVLWVHYVAMMRLKMVRDEGKLTTAAKVFGYPALVVGLLLDLVVNVVVGTIVFVEPPQKMTLSARLTRLGEGSSGWRRRRADRIRKALLDDIDPSGIHRG